MCGDRMDEPNVAADDTSLSYYGIAAKNGCVGVDGDIVFNGGVALGLAGTFLDA